MDDICIHYTASNKPNTELDFTWVFYSLGTMATLTLWLTVTYLRHVVGPNSLIHLPFEWERNLIQWYNSFVCGTSFTRNHVNYKSVRLEVFVGFEGVHPLNSHAQIKSSIKTRLMNLPTKFAIVWYSINRKGGNACSD